MNLKNITSKDNQFYPTPQNIVDMMLYEVDFKSVTSILEASAGKGNILKSIAVKEKTLRQPFDVDAIEIDAYLRSILKYNFSEEYENSLRKNIKDIEHRYKYDYHTRSYIGITESDYAELCRLKEEEMKFFTNGINIVYDDFLNFSTYKQYDLIILNPPFANGELHLLKALDLQKHGGTVVCLLNAETILNPYSENRKLLVKKLNELNANIKYINDAFTDAERSASVDVALISVNIEKTVETVNIFENMQQTNYADENTNVTDLDVVDFINSIVTRFNIELAAGIDIIKKYNALKPYILDSVSSQYAKPILQLKDNSDRNITINKYVEKTRYKYWEALLSNKELISKLTTKLQREYQNKISDLKKYDFNMFNIQNLLNDMNVNIKQGIENEILAKYDTLTFEHSYYGETCNNRHYYDGWITNKAYKIDKKVILPVNVFGYWGNPSSYDAIEAVEDIERIFNYLDGKMTVGVDLHNQIHKNFDRGNTKNIQLKYFDVTFYKKGTMHIKFTCPELVERLNIYVGKNKNWLPQDYGRKRYSQMNEKEKSVIDSFQGKEAYENICNNASYYLAPINEHKLLEIAG